LPHVSTGDILRQNVKDSSQLGKEAKSYMDQGLLVPDELVGRMLAQRFDDPDVKGGFILDGYPRNIAQAKTLDGILKARKMGIDFVIYLDTSDKVIIQRLTGRLVCSKCAMNFHIINMPPKNPGICDNCSGKLYQRTDDTEETVKKRIDVYKKEVASLIDYYKGSGKLFTFSADGEAGIVLKQIIELAQKHNDSLKV
jgi:adenylate kinase